MENYYRILGISPGASAAELEAAVDALYQENLRRANAHNRDVADEANRMLRLLEEQIRPALTDSARRAAYDAQLTVGEQAGGLADPGAQQGVPISPPRFEKPGKGMPQPGVATVGFWVCPQCGAPSPRGTRFCGNCSYQIGIECPKCSKLIFANMVFCPECGVEVKPELALKLAQEEAKKAALARAQLTVLQAQIHAKRTEVETLERLISSWQSWWSTKTPAKRQNLGCAANLAQLAILPLSLMIFGGSAFLLRAVGIPWGVGVWILLPIVMAFVLVGMIVSQWYFGRPVIIKQVNAYRQQIAQIEQQIAQLQAQPARNE